MDRSYARDLTLTILQSYRDRFIVLAGIRRVELAQLVNRLPFVRSRGRRPAWSLEHRVLLTCIALRTNLTVRELAAVTRISKSTVHRIIAAVTPQLFLANRRIDGSRGWWTEP